MPTKIIMPQLGESVVEGTVTKWLKQEGERIEEMESLLEVNTDKVDTEIPSPAGGTLLKIVVPEGETVRAGTVIAWVGEPGEGVELRSWRRPTRLESPLSPTKAAVQARPPWIAARHVPILANGARLLAQARRRRFGRGQNGLGGRDRTDRRRLWRGRGLPTGR